MFVTGIVFGLLVVLVNSGLLFVVFAYVTDALLGIGVRAFDRRIRKVSADQYLQLVALPLCYAITGGLLATGISIIVDHPPWKHDSRIDPGYVLLAIGIIIATVGPLAINASYRNPKDQIVALRIDRLSGGDGAGDTAAEIIATIDKSRAAIATKLNSKRVWLLVFLLVALTSDTGWLFLDYKSDRVSPGVLQTLVMVALILCALAAGYWLRPVSLRSELRELNAYRTEAARLAPPILPASRRGRVRHTPARPHALHVRSAVGGLLIGLGVALLDSVRRKERRNWR
jgi:hypothetical protein